MKKEINYKIVIAAIGGIVALELGAMFNGMNGMALTLAISAIAGLAGWTIPQPNLKR